MTENTTNLDRHSPDYEFRPFPGDTPPPASKKKPWFAKPLVWLPVGALLLGLGIGGASTPEPQTIEVPGPERTVTKEVKVNVPTTPAACIEALDLAQQGFTYSAESMGYMNDAVQAAGRLNVAGLEQANADLEKLNPKIQALTAPMQAATAECRAK